MEASAHARTAACGVRRSAGGPRRGARRQGRAYRSAHPALPRQSPRRQFRQARSAEAAAACLPECWAELKALGVAWVQIDEPILGLQSTGMDRGNRPTYTALAPSSPDILLATYFRSAAGTARCSNRCR
ncbi:MAG: hypothetical protein KIT18_00040 [Burkholderiales bacterium]|nr:hypothetical protein [Burkholderiales bacterium]